MTTMELGAVFPTTEIGGDPGAVRAFAQAAEELGYRRITTYDHVLGAEHADRQPPLTGPYSVAHAFREPMVLLGYLAALTSRIELATGVLVLPQRQTALVAKQAAEVDVLSNGRFVLGVGTGWNHVEYTALGVPFRDRGRRLEEQVDVLRALWREPVVDVDGRFHRIERAGLNPLPGRLIPIWFGGTSDAALARSARIGDGHVFGLAGDRIAAPVRALLGHLDAAGRDPATFGMEAVIDIGFGPDAWRAERDRWESVGGTTLSVRTMSTAAERLGVPPSRFRTPDDHIDALADFMTAVSA
jgi:probable F420-dependent oxidoreductase